MHTCSKVNRHFHHLHVSSRWCMTFTPDLSPRYFPFHYNYKTKLNRFLIIVTFRMYVCMYIVRWKHFVFHLPFLCRRICTLVVLNPIFRIRMHFKYNTHKYRLYFLQVTSFNLNTRVSVGIVLIQRLPRVNYKNRTSEPVTRTPQ